MEGFLAAAVIAGTPLLFATVGELLTEKAGNLNLGVEGLMVMGAVIGFIVGYRTGSPILAFLGALAAGSAGSLIFAMLTVSLRVNQVVTGLTLTIFGQGFASFVGSSVMGAVLPYSIKEFFQVIAIPGLSSIPFIGPIFFKQDIFVYFGYLVVIVTATYLYKTKKGLNFRPQAVMLLIDSRHEPTQNDKVMYEWLLYHFYTPYILLTKTDKISKNQMSKSLKTAKEYFSDAPHPPILYSAQTGQGKQEVLDLLQHLTETDNLTP